MTEESSDGFYILPGDDGEAEYSLKLSYFNFPKNFVKGKKIDGSSIGDMYHVVFFKESEDSLVIIERYRDFIKEINLKYSTTEEQKFLSQLDFNDPLDLELAIPFYSRKLTEIANYYNKKREEAKYQVTKKKLLGTNNLLAQEIRNNIING